jgi:ppGpp synthetase/RelA/SpoT-type nucleotidyltranferase
VAQTEEDLRKEVEKYLKRWRRSYETFLDDINAELVRFRDRGDNFDCIYRIYSRADKQRGGDKLKSVDRIVKKLVRERSRSTKFPIKDMNDIVGITMVVYYFSDLEKIAKLLQAFRNSKFEIITCEDKSQKGYFAKHFDIKSLDPRHNGIRAEVQLKSLLHDGWSAKIHDFTYNPAIKVDPSITTMIERLGATLEQVEKMSDDLRNLANRHLQADESRRDMAVTTLMFQFTQDQKKEPTFGLQILPKKLLASKETIADCDSTDAALIRFIAQWRDCRRVGLLPRNLPVYCSNGRNTKR